MNQKKKERRKNRKVGDSNNSDIDYALLLQWEKEERKKENKTAKT